MGFQKYPTVVILPKKIGNQRKEEQPPHFHAHPSYRVSIILAKNPGVIPNKLPQGNQQLLIFFITLVVARRSKPKSETY